MAKSIQDIIPVPLAPPVQPTPIGILRALASLLGRQTNHKVLGDVRTVPIEEKLLHVFRARVPSLDDYLLELFRVSQDSSRLFPVKVSSGFSQSDYTATNEEELIEFLAALFQSESMQSAISVLMAQAA